MTAAEAAALLLPIAPTTLAESGLSEDIVVDLVRKTLNASINLSGMDIGRRLGLGFGVVQSSLDHLKSQRQIEIVGGPMLGPAAYHYRLTEAGRARAESSLSRNQYIGLAPVPIDQYRAYMNHFSRSVVDCVTPDEVRAAFADLILSDQTLDELGTALSARHSVFIYGHPGNGKTVIAQTMRRLLTGELAIPHAIEVNGNIIRFFDPALHEPLATPDGDDAGEVRYDRRWIRCRRPMISVGGELTLESLALAYEPRSGLYRAPVQTIANGGVLVIDDFGRQQCPPRDLLNWWMVPLESRVEYMTLQSGDKVEMPFQTLVIFSTNIRPKELVDEAFLRRIRYKICAQNPTRTEFVRIFERACEQQQIEFDASLVDALIEGFYVPRGLELRACHPRDLINQALALASYQGRSRQLTADLLESACASYFIADEGAESRVA